MDKEYDPIGLKLNALVLTKDMMPFSSTRTPQEVVEFADVIMQYLTKDSLEIKRHERSS